VNKEYFLFYNFSHCWLLEDFCFPDPVKGTNSVYRDVYEHDVFLYQYISVALLSCSDSETFSSELIFVRVQSASLSESFDAQFKL
jgi:hypothetical protein